MKKYWAIWATFLVLLFLLAVAHGGEPPKGVEKCYQAAPPKLPAVIDMICHENTSFLDGGQNRRSFVCIDREKKQLNFFVATGGNA